MGWVLILYMLGGILTVAHDIYRDAKEGILRKYSMSESLPVWALVFAAWPFFAYLRWKMGKSKRINLRGKL